MINLQLNKIIILAFLVIGCSNKEKLTPSKVLVGNKQINFGTTKEQIETDLNRELHEVDYFIGDGDRNANQYRIYYNPDQGIDAQISFMFDDNDLLSELFCIYTLPRDMDPKALSECCFIDFTINDLYRDTIINAATYIDYEYDSSIHPKGPDKVHIRFIERIKE